MGPNSVKTAFSQNCVHPNRQIHTHACEREQTCRVKYILMHAKDCTTAILEIWPHVCTHTRPNINTHAHAHTYNMHSTYSRKCLHITYAHYCQLLRTPELHWLSRSKLFHTTQEVATMRVSFFYLVVRQ